MSKILSAKEWSIAESSFIEHEKATMTRNQSLINLINAVFKSNIEKVEQLIKEGAPLNLSIEGISPLAAAVECNDLHMVQFLIKKGAILKHKFGEKGIDAAWYALDYEHLNMFEYLIGEGASLKFRSTHKHQTRLIQATILSNVEAVRFLCSKKATNVNAYDSDGRTALHYNFLKMPYTEKDIEIARIILNTGGDLEIEDNDNIAAHVYADEDAQLSLLEKYKIEKAVSLNQTQKAKLNKHPEMAEENEPEVDFIQRPSNAPSGPKMRKRL